MIKILFFRLAQLRQFLGCYYFFLPKSNHSAYNNYLHYLILETVKIHYVIFSIFLR